MKANVKVIEVNEAPAIGKPEMMGGIRSKEAAEKWAGKRGYATVYWFKSRERVYADKRQPVDAQAQALEQRSVQLLNLSENGSAADWLAIALLFLMVISALGYAILTAGMR